MTTRKSARKQVGKAEKPSPAKPPTPEDGHVFFEWAYRRAQARNEKVTRRQLPRIAFLVRQALDDVRPRNLTLKGIDPFHASALGSLADRAIERLTEAINRIEALPPDTVAAVDHDNADGDSIAHGEGQTLTEHRLPSEDAGPWVPASEALGALLFLRGQISRRSGPAWKKERRRNGTARALDLSNDLRGHTSISQMAADDIASNVFGVTRKAIENLRANTRRTR